MSISDALKKAGLSYQREDSGKPLPVKIVGKTEQQQWSNAMVAVTPLKKRS